MKQLSFSAIEAMHDTGKNSQLRHAPKSSLFPMNWKDDIRPTVNKMKDFLCALLFVSLLVMGLTSENAVGQIQFDAPVIDDVGCG